MIGDRPGFETQTTQAKEGRTLKRFLFFILLSWGALITASPAAHAQARFEPREVDAMSPGDERRWGEPGEVPSERTPVGDDVEAPDAAEAASNAPMSAAPSRPIFGSVREEDGEAESGFKKSGLNLFDVLTSLGLVVGLILLIRWAYGKFGGRVVAGSTPAVEVLSRTMLAPRHHLLILRVGPRILLVSDSAAGGHTLAEITDPQEVAEILSHVTAAQTTSITQNFSGLMKRFQRDEEPGFDPEEHGLPPVEREASSGGLGDGVTRARQSISGLLSSLKSSGGKSQ